MLASMFMPIQSIGDTNNLARKIVSRMEAASEKELLQLWSWYGRRNQIDVG